MAIDAAGPGKSGDVDGKMLGWLPFLHRFLSFAGPYWTSEEKWKAAALSVALVVFTVAQVAVPIALNLWMKSLFDALENRSMARFIQLTGILLLIILANVSVLTIHLLVKRRLQIGWRKWLTRRAMGEWMTAGRPYQIAYVPGAHDNPDGRIAEDARITTEYALDLGHSLLYCSLLLVSFVDILWTLSGPAELRLGNIALYLPGYLVWAAFLYAALGGSVALLLGRPLVRATERRQAVEANFRFGLVHARENSLAIALAHGEEIERRRFGHLLDDAAAAWDRQTAALARVMLYSASWSVLWQVFPIVIVAPRYIEGLITLGVLMQTAQAFQQATAALSWPIDNLAKLADWRASVRRVMELEYSIKQLAAHGLPANKPGVEIVMTDKAALAFHDVSISTPDGHPEIAAFTVDLRQGEQVLISGEPRVAAMLYKVVAGLWPWGKGKVDLPAGARLFFAPEHPYLPIGTLREAICYPASPQRFSDRQLHAALDRVGLEQLVTRLGESGNWDDLLELGEQQRLGFARLLLRRPSWILMQDATDAMGPKGEEQMMDILRAECPEATVIILGRHPPPDRRMTRKITLLRQDGAVAASEASAPLPSAMVHSA